MHLKGTASHRTDGGAPSFASFRISYFAKPLTSTHAAFSKESRTNLVKANVSNRKSETWQRVGCEQSASKFYLSHPSQTARRMGHPPPWPAQIARARLQPCRKSCTWFGLKPFRLHPFRYGLKAPAYYRISGYSPLALAASVWRRSGDELISLFR